MSFLITIFVSDYIRKSFFSLLHEILCVKLFWYTLHTYTVQGYQVIMHVISISGMIDVPGVQDGSSLRSLIEKPPVCGNSFSPLTGNLLTGFRLHTGPVLIHIHTHTDHFFTLFYSFQVYLQTICAHALPSSLNSTDWCIFNLQRRRASTSIDTIDHRTPYHQVSVLEYNILLIRNFGVEIDVWSFILSWWVWMMSLSLKPFSL